MNALSVLQPWAWLLAHGYKDIENRTWPSSFDGRFLIHAGKRWGEEQIQDLEHIRESFPAIRLPDRFDLGGFVGIATASGSITRSSSPWFSGPYGIPVSDARPVPFIRFRGQLGWFKVPDDMEVLRAAADDDHDTPDLFGGGSARAARPAAPERELETGACRRCDGSGRGNVCFLSDQDLQLFAAGEAQRKRAQLIEHLVALPDNAARARSFGRLKIFHSAEFVQQLREVVWQRMQQSKLREFEVDP